MRVEYIAMYVNDLEKARDFLLNTLMRQRMMVIIIKPQAFVPFF